MLATRPTSRLTSNKSEKLWAVAIKAYPSLLCVCLVKEPSRFVGVPPYLPFSPKADSLADSAIKNFGDNEVGCATQVLRIPKARKGQPA